MSSIDWHLVVEVIKALAWPLLAGFALYLFRVPLVELAGQIARRASKVSVFEISVELATLPELRPSWSAGTENVRQLTSAAIFDSFSQTLFQELLSPGRADYAIADLGAGREWLTSRLFIFALVLGAVRDLRAFVFLETVPGTRRRFLGVATTANIRRAQGARYPWLEEAFVRALREGYPPDPPNLAPGPAVPADVVGQSRFSNQRSPLDVSQGDGRLRYAVQVFIEKLHRKTTPPAGEGESYLELGTSPQEWERAHWIDGERLERDLGGVLDDEWVEDSPDVPRSVLSDALIRRTTPFVALVDKDRRFHGLVDRHTLLSQMSIVNTSESKKAQASA
jgi:hypothetical protein